MVQTLSAKNVRLRDLIDQFKLWFSRADRFLFDWQEGLPSLTELEMQYLDQVKAGYLSLTEYPPASPNGFLFR